MTEYNPVEPDNHTWPADQQPEETYCRQCGSDQRSLDPGGMCWKCHNENAAGYTGHEDQEIDADGEPIDEVYCCACGGTGDAPDNGTNMGECDECCGYGLMGE